MAPNDVFHKTAKGSAGIAARSIKLAPMTRMAMVIIDGVKPFSDLCSKLGGEAAAQAAITELLGHGLIALSAVADASAPIAGAAVPASPAPAASMSFEQLRQWTSHAASKAMGPMGDDYCLRIERAKNLEELNAAAERARNAIDMITNVRARSGSFWEDYERNRG